MGLLDMFYGDSPKAVALRKGLLSAGLATMSAKTGGNLMSAIGQGGMQGVGAYGDSLDEAKKDERYAAQDARQATADSQDAEKFNAWKSGNQTATADAQAMKELGAKYYDPNSGNFDEKGYIQELWKLNPSAAMQYTEKMRDSQAAGGDREYATPIAGTNGNWLSFYNKGPRVGQAVPLVVSGTGGDGAPKPQINPSFDPTNKAAIATSEVTAKDNAAAVSAAKVSYLDNSATLRKIEAAEKLLPVATNSGIGAARDFGAGLIGANTQAGQAASELDTISAWLTSGVPRLGGGTSDADLGFYKTMAGGVADKSKPWQQRMAQLQQLKEFTRSDSKRRQEIMATNNGMPTTNERVFKVIRPQ